MTTWSNRHTPKDYDYYNRWTFLFPLYTLVTIFAVSIITIVIAALFRKALGKKVMMPYDKLNRRQICLKLCLSAIRDVMLRTVKFLIFEFEYEKIEKTDNKSKNKHTFEYRLNGVPVHLFVIQYLFIVLLSILAVSLLSFWNVFFAESQLDECSLLQDCFPLFRDNSTPIDINPITNCADHLVNEDTTIICFQVVYWYSEGLGEAGGFLFSMQVIMNIVIYVVVSMFRTLIKITKIASNRKVVRERSMSDIGRNWCISMPRLAKTLTMVLTLIMYLIIVILLPIWVLHEREDFLITITTTQRRMQLALYAYTVFVMFLVPLIVSSGVFARRTYNRIKVKTDQETDVEMNIPGQPNPANPANTESQEENQIDHQQQLTGTQAIE